MESGFRADHAARGIDLKPAAVPFCTHNRAIRVTGWQTDADGAAGKKPTVRTIESAAAFGFAPAIEYSWTSHLGLLVGVRVIRERGNTPSSITPVMAINDFR